MAGQEPVQIVFTPEPIVIGRSSKATARLFNPTASRKHATIEVCAVGIKIVDHDSRYGTFVNGRRVRSCQAQLGDRVQFGTTLAYRVEPGCLALEQSTQGMSLDGRGLTLIRGNRVLVQGVGLTIKPDAFVGILAPSGAGKSTLLSCLGGYLPPQSGQLLFDHSSDVFGELDRYRSLIGYVTQEDAVYLNLSARQNLFFAAKLRLGNAATSDQIEDAVHRVLKVTDLTTHQNSPKAGQLSGGQRKRLSVAIELLKRPRLLLLDEPTSGLDPATEANLMEHLRRVAHQGTTVVCTTHLMEHLLLFDEILVLGISKGVGHLAFRGCPSELISHFGCRNFADLYERLMEGGFEPLLEAQTPIDIVIPNGEMANARLPHDAPAAAELANAKDGNCWQEGRVLLTENTINMQWLQLWIIYGRAASVFFNDRWLWTTVVAQPIVLGALVCVTQYRTDATKSILFFLVVLVIWLGLNNSIRDLVRERKLYLRDRLAGLDSRAYLASKAVFFATIGMAQIFLLLIVVGVSRRFIFGESTLQHVSLLWLSVVLTLSYLGALAVGLTASALVRTESTAIAILPLLLMPQLLLSAVATGEVDQTYFKPRAFRPLAVTLRDSQSAPEEYVAKVVDLLSMGTFSRPATLLAEAPNVKGFHPHIWIADMIHLLFLVTAAWVLAYLIFGRSESRWLRLLDLE